MKPNGIFAARRPSLRRRPILGTIAVAVLLLAASVSGAVFAATPAPSAPGRVMLSYTDDPASSVTVTWTDAQSATAGSVRYGMGRSLSDAREVRAVPVPNASPADANGVRFTAELVGLFPGTTYYYNVGGAGARSETKSFTTAERDAQSFSFLYLGDIQVTERAETDFAAWGKLIGNAYAAHPGLAFALQGGDIVESGIDTAQWAAFLDNATLVFSKIPFMPTNGNHESNFPSGKPELYLDTFTLPRNGPAGFAEEFYSFDYGAAHFLVLNSWVFSGEQKLNEADLAAIDDWVTRDLSASDATWKIALTHVPLYAVHSDAAADAARAHWAPLFERYGVSLVFVGHQHVYSRLVPLTGGVPDFDDGVTYIMGNSGLKFYSSADETRAERTIYNTSTYQVVRVDGARLTVQTFDGAGAELDFVELSPRGAVLPLSRDATRVMMIGCFSELMIRLLTHAEKLAP
jgi:hypothetical protein